MKVFYILLMHLMLRCAEASGPASAAANAGIKALDYRYFVAGGVCAATSHGITTPIDVVKTKMQARPDLYKGIYHATVSILNTEGPGALLGGLGPTVVGYGIEGAMKFGVYEVMKPIMAGILRDNVAGAYIAASIIAGAVASVLLCPMESARIRVVTDDEYKGKSMIETLPKLISDGGVSSLFSGLFAMLSKQVPYTMAKQVSFDIIAGFLYSYLSKTGKGPVDDLKWIVSVISAFLASIFACISSQPGDMILTETYKGNTAAGFFGVISSIYMTKGGVNGFFTGTGARILHVSTIITSQLVIYDIVKQLLGLPATGSH